MATVGFALTIDITDVSDSTVIDTCLTLLVFSALAATVESMQR
jgi:hypothetical protein